MKDASQLSFHITTNKITLNDLLGIIGEKRREKTETNTNKHKKPQPLKCE